MIDNFALVVTHGLLALALWRLVRRDDLDSDPPIEEVPPPPPPAPDKGQLRA